MMVISAFSLGAGLIACVLSFFLHATKPSIQPKIGVIELLQVIKKKLLLYSCLALVQQGVQMATTMSFTNQIIQDLGATNMVIGFSSIIYMLSAILFAKLASTRFLELLTKKQWIYSSFLLLGIYCLMVPQTGSIFIVCFLQLIPEMGTGILFSLLNSEAIKSIPQ